MVLIPSNGIPSNCRVIYLWISFGFLIFGAPGNPHKLGNSNSKFPFHLVVQKT